MRHKHTNYAWPMIALYTEEVEAIIDNILDDEMIHEFYDWLDAWEEHIFERANVVIKRRNRKGEWYYQYEIKGRRMICTIISPKGKELRFVSHIDYCNFVDEWDLRIIKKWPLSTDVNLLLPEGASTNLQERYDALFGDVKELEADIEAKNVESNAFSLDTILNMDAEDSVKKAMIEARQKEIVEEKGKLQDRLLEAKKEREQIEDCFEDMLLEGCKHFLKIICTSLFYFTIRVPKVYERRSEAHTAGYKKHNEAYNPFKKLQPHSIVRPKNGTRTYLERSWTRRTESWHVKGHKRQYKSGKTVWIKPYVKGTGENLRLSIYINEMAGDAKRELSEA